MGHDGANEEVEELERKLIALLDTSYTIKGMVKTSKERCLYV